MNSMTMNTFSKGFGLVGRESFVRPFGCGGNVISDDTGVLKWTLVLGGIGDVIVGGNVLRGTGDGTGGNVSGVTGDVFGGSSSLSRNCAISLPQATSLIDRIPWCHMNSILLCSKCHVI